tara:strand:- start:225 stop:989 length:765 start_codon:yes stop_codon:yes gene_type:complete
MNDYKRKNGRLVDQIRKVTFERDFVSNSDGSVLISQGNTRVLCTANIENKVPPWIKGLNKGWVTAEYSMLPGSASSRVSREVVKGKQSGRTSEIQRLIGRSLRSSLDLCVIPEKTIILDCDVIQADGGTRCAAITGSWLALFDALQKKESNLLKDGRLNSIQRVGAISVGVIDQRMVLDLDYEEDATCGVDLNIVMKSDLSLVEIQGTGEKTTFSKIELVDMITVAEKGLAVLFEMQRIMSEKISLKRLTSSDI